MRLRLSPLLALLAACAPALPPVHSPTPNELAAIRRQAALDPAPDAQVALATAWRASGQRDSARLLLERVVRSHPRHPGALLSLGITADEQGDYARAESVYREYVALGRQAPLRREADRRLLLVRRQALAASVRQALASEAELSRLPAQPRAVAVFPFAYTGDDARMRSLSRALSALLTTDLGQTDRIRVLEREQIQALMGEMKLSASGLVDPATAVRSGRLLRAGRIVQGQVGGSESALRIDAAVVGVDSGVRAQPIQVQDRLGRLFDMEKTIALELYRSMGIELTVAERERVSHRPTENLEALLAFGQGLQAEDAGQPGQAVEHFERALRLDPTFLDARQGARDGQAVVASEGVTPERLARAAQQQQLVRGPALLPAGFRPPASMGSDAADILLPDPIGRSPGSELLGLDGVAIPATIVVIIVLGHL